MATGKFYKIRIDDEYRAELEAARVAGGHPSVAAFIRSAVQQALARSPQPRPLCEQFRHVRHDAEPQR